MSHSLDMTLDECVEAERKSNRKRRYNNNRNANQYDRNSYPRSKRPRYNTHNSNYHSNNRRFRNEYYDEDYHNDSNYNKHTHSSKSFVTKNREKSIEMKQGLDDDDDDDLFYENLGYNHHNNYGWRKGWSIEQEFKKQSSKIDVKPSNKVYLTKRCIDNEYPKEKYRRRKGEDKKHVIHWGQRKLLLSEIEFLSKYLNKAKKGDDGYKLVVYAGAAPGKHIPLLIEMFDDIQMELYDPNDFSAVVKGKARINVHQKYFTDEIAQELGAMERDILFISDIRTADHRRQSGTECEETIIKDNVLQSNWVRALHSNGNLMAAMLKFRLPYPHLVDEHKQECLDGAVYTQCWAPVTSTETRLHIIPDENGNINTTYYDCKDYEQQLFWFNTRARQSYIDNTRYCTPNVGIINNYDCFTECMILQEYYMNIKGFKQNEVKRHDVIKCVKRITQFIGAKRCLLTKPADPHEQKKGLGMVNHSHFHSNQQIANPIKNKTDPHHLYGYEGLLGIDPDDKTEINTMIMNAFKENGFDESKIKQFDQMLSIYSVKDVCMDECSILPSYNRPLYHLVSIKNDVYVIPLEGFSAMWFKVGTNYVEFYNKCFGETFGGFCCLTGFLIDNHNTKQSLRYTFMALDVLTKDMENNENEDFDLDEKEETKPNDYEKRKEQMRVIVENYEKFKDTVIKRDIFKFIPIKIEICPSECGSTQIKQFKNKRIKRFNVGDYDFEMKENKNVLAKLNWNDIHFDFKEYETTPNGYYLDKVALNTRIGGYLWIKHNNPNIMLSELSFSNIDY